MTLTDKTSTSTPPLTKRPAYLAPLARSADDVQRAQRLRFEVFNLELGDGLIQSHASIS